LIRVGSKAHNAGMKPYVRLIAVLLFGALASASAFAAQLGDSPNRTELHRADLSGAPGMEVISSIVRLEPGQTAPVHSHHGIEAGYVVQGALVQYPGHPPQMLKAGTSIFNLRDVVHSGFTVVGHQTLVIFTVHVVDKNKPLYQPVKTPVQ
jgi:quercetin dioxygenase-like cupin family protein